jgi:hypothetical protein
MNDETTTLDQTDEDILTYRASDEALEAAADTSGRPCLFSPITMKLCGCW